MTYAHTGLIQEIRLPIEIRTTTHRIVAELLGISFAAEILKWIRPQEVAHRAESRRLFEAVQLQHSKLNSLHSGN